MHKAKLAFEKKLDSLKLLRHSLQDQEVATTTHHCSEAEKDLSLVVQEEEGEAKSFVSVGGTGPNHFSLSKLGLDVEEDFSISDLKY